MRAGLEFVDTNSHWMLDGLQNEAALMIIEFSILSSTSYCLSKLLA
jgi:hypothetical protein